MNNLTVTAVLPVLRFKKKHDQPDSRGHHGRLRHALCRTCLAEPQVRACRARFHGTPLEPWPGVTFCLPDYQIARFGSKIAFFLLRSRLQIESCFACGEASSTRESLKSRSKKTKTNSQWRKICGRIPASPVKTSSARTQIWSAIGNTLFFQYGDPFIARGIAKLQGLL